MVNPPSYRGLEQAIALDTADAARFDRLILSLDLPEEERIALRYLLLTHGKCEFLGEGIGYAPRFAPLEELMTEIENKDVEAYRKRYRKAAGIPPLQMEYAVELKLIEDKDFQQKIFELYKTKIWPVIRQSIN